MCRRSPPTAREARRILIINNDHANDGLRFINDVRTVLVARLSAKYAEESKSEDDKQPSPPPPGSGHFVQAKARFFNKGELSCNKDGTTEQAHQSHADDGQDQLPGAWKKRKRSSRGRVNGIGKCRRKKKDMANVRIMLDLVRGWHSEGLSVAVESNVRDDASYESAIDERDGDVYESAIDERDDDSD